MAEIEQSKASLYNNAIPWLKSNILLYFARSNESAIEEALKNMSLKMKENLKNAEKSVGKLEATVEAKLESRDQNMKNALSSQQSDLQKQLQETDRKFESKLSTLEKSAEANLESQIKKLRQDDKESGEFTSKFQDLNEKMGQHETRICHLETEMQVRVIQILKLIPFL